MHISKALIFGLALAAFAASSQADDEPTRYACTFNTGTTWVFEDGVFQNKTPAALSFDITDINLDRQTAQLMPQGGKIPVTLKIVRAINANHFLEVVNEGFLNLTTVYDKDEKSGTYPAVHSRHFGVLGQPVVAQYIGTCKAK